MGQLLNIMTPLHRRAKRDYMRRMIDDKVQCMVRAREYGRDYWDGDRRYGYGGYRYIEGYWTPAARALIDHYGLTDGAKILDVGCGKAFLLHELKRLLPNAAVAGFDISQYGLDGAADDVRPFLFRHRAQDPYPFGDAHFDLVISLTTLHNLRVFELKTALQEIQRVGKSKYVVVESYRSEFELFNLQCWALTCESFFHPSEWTWLYREFGYTGDYEFLYFE